MCLQFDTIYTVGAWTVESQHVKTRSPVHPTLIYRSLVCIAKHCHYKLCPFASKIQFYQSMYLYTRRHTQSSSGQLDSVVMMLSAVRAPSEGVITRGLPAGHGRNALRLVKIIFQNPTINVAAGVWLANEIK
jgi:hypothetical protein